MALIFNSPACSCCLSIFPSCGILTAAPLSATTVNHRLSEWHLTVTQSVKRRFLCLSVNERRTYLCLCGFLWFPVSLLSVSSHQQEEERNLVGDGGVAEGHCLKDRVKKKMDV